MNVTMRKHRKETTCRMNEPTKLPRQILNYKPRGSRLIDGPRNGGWRIDENGTGKSLNNEVKMKMSAKSILPMFSEKER